MDASAEAATASTRELERAQERAAVEAKSLDRSLDGAQKRGGLLQRSFGGLRGSAVGLAAGFVGVHEALQFLGSSARAASDLSQAISTSSVIFGDNADVIDQWARTASKSVGLSHRDATEAAVGFGDMFQQLGFTNDAAADKSISTVQLAADLGAFRNLPTADVVERITAAFRGEYDSLQLLIPNINAARVETEALAMTGKTSADALTAQEKAVATLAIVQQDGAAAAGAYARESEGLAGKQQELTAEWENAKARLGELLVGPMTGLVGLLTDALIPAFEFTIGVVGDAVEMFTDLPGPVQVAIGALAAVALLKGPMSSFATTVATKIGDLVTGIGSATTSVGGFRTAAGGLMGFFGGPWGLAVAGAVTGLSLLSSGMFSSREATEEAQAAQRDFAAALRESRGAIDDNVRAAAAKAAQDAGLLDLADDMGISLALVTDAVLGNRDAYDELMVRLAEYEDAAISAGEGNAGIGFVETAEEAAGFRANLDELAPTVEQTRADAQQLAEATDTTGSSMADAATEVRDFAQEASDAREAVDRFKVALDILTGANVSLIEVETALAASIDDAEGALEDMNGTVLDSTGELNLQSEAGRAAADVLLGVRDSGNQLIATLIQQGATSDDVRRRDAQLRESFIRSAEQMGISRQAAERLADEILGIPSERETRIEADTAEASRRIGGIQGQLDGLQSKTITIRTVYTQTGSMGGVNGPRAPGLAFGGPVPGSSPSDRADNVPIMATAGAFMHQRPAVRKYGMPFMAAVNEGRFPVELARGYAFGGPIITINADRTGVLQAEHALSAAKDATRYVEAPGYGVPGGGGSLGSSYQSLFAAIKRAVPEARLNSGHRPGDPGYHGRGKAADIGLMGVPGGIGNSFMASVNQWLYDNHRGSLAELIYDGLGDNRPDVKNSRNPTYNAATRAAHRNHVHAAVYDQGGILPPGLTLAYNGTGFDERILTPPQDNYYRRQMELAGVRDLQPTEVNGFVNNGTVVFRDEEEFYRRQEASKRQTLASLGF